MKRTRDQTSVSTGVDITLEPEIPGVVPANAALWTSIVVVAVTTGFILWNLAPDAILTNTTPTGGDLGAHVWGPKFLRDHLLTHGMVAGWSPDWFAGFPAFRFYMLVPSLFIAGLSYLLPYGVAFKVVVAACILALPASAYAMGRMFGTTLPEPQLMAIMTLPFTFDTSFAIYGGNISSSLAGEFAFAMSLSFALLGLGLVAQGVATGKRRIATAVVLALTVLTHIIPAMFCAVGSLVIVAMRADWRRVRWTLGTGITAMCLGAFWWAPFVGRHAWFNDMGWEKRTDYLHALAPDHLHLALGLALVGALASILRFRHLGIFLTIMAACTALAFVALPKTALWNARLLPFWYLVVWMLAAIGIAEAARLGGIALRNTRATIIPVAGVAIAGIITLIGVGIPLDRVPGIDPSPTRRSHVPYLAESSFRGYESSASYPEYREIVATMASIGREQGCGRAYWEFNQSLNRYGTTMALMLLPYWTNGCIGSMEGLYMESSLTTPFHWLAQSSLSESPSRPQRDLPYGLTDVNLGVTQLQALGVRYFMATSTLVLDTARKHPDLVPLAKSGPWEVFRVRQTALVQPLENMPVVYSGPTRWRTMAIDWFQNPGRAATVLAREGPRSWKRTSTGLASSVTPIEPTRVSKIRVADDSVSFDVDRVGVPVLVKVSAFPNWKAVNADGPFQVAPNSMVVIPRRHHVELRYRATTLEVASNLVTIAALLAIVLMSNLGRRTRQWLVTHWARRIRWPGASTVASRQATEGR